ncbi:MAG: tetratricopeptide repeat protein [Pseudomonadota bacterium]
MSRLMTLIALALFSAAAASAQFGPKPDTPRSTEEIYADRAMQTAAGFLEANFQDVATSEDGVDPERAAFWYSEARSSYTALCENRTQPVDAWSRNCFKLGFLYLRGQGTPQNYPEAEKLFLTACEQGDHIDSCLRQAHTDHTGSAGQKDWSRARKLYDRACDAGSPSGCAGLGNMLYRAQGGLPDRSRGARLLQGACADDYLWACERLTVFGLPRSSFQ